MPPYKRLAIISLAASSIFPALSAPTCECQKQSRSEVEERMNMASLERLGTDFTLPERPFGSSSKRATEAPESRAFVSVSPASAGDRLMAGATGIGLLAVLGTGIYGSVKAFEKDKHQRDLSPAQMIAALDSFDNRAGIPPEDSDTFLRLLSRALNELD